METAIGVILGALATVLASRYYFLRSVNKSLGVYRLLNSFVFAGIGSDVRKQLSFRFRDKEVDELQQLVFLIANDGERAISNVIEPLTLTIGAGIEVLDASILHRHPNALQADVLVPLPTSPSPKVTFKFPLLNKGEFFVVKLLLSGRLSLSGLSFEILADDLPRSLPIRELPPRAVHDTGHKIVWGLLGTGAVVLLFPAWICYCVYLLYVTRPDLSPYPWSSFVVSLESILLLIPGALVAILFGFLGFLMMAGGVFGGEFPPPRGPRFPIPRRLHGAVFSYRMLQLPSAFDETSPDETASAPERERSNNQMQRTAPSQSERRR